MDFEDKVEIGNGIYTLPDLAKILDLDYHKVRRLLNEYWENRFGNNLNAKYSWSSGNTKAVSFRTLVEFYVYYHFKHAGISTQNILKAHLELAKMFDTPFPFANSNILQSIYCSGKKILFEVEEDNIINLDFTKQLNLTFIMDFVKKLEFDNNNIAKRLYPLGKRNSVIIDPKHQFGQPTILGTNLFPETIYNLHLRKESKKIISASFGISIKQVNDAIKFCEKYAA